MKKQTKSQVMMVVVITLIATVAYLLANPKKVVVSRPVFSRREGASSPSDGAGIPSATYSKLEAGCLPPDGSLNRRARGNLTLIW